MALIDVQIELEFRSFGFCGGRKAGEAGEELSQQVENQQQTLTHMRRRLRESNSGHRGGRRAHIYCATRVPV